MADVQNTFYSCKHVHTCRPLTNTTATSGKRQLLGNANNSLGHRDASASMVWSLEVMRSTRKFIYDSVKRTFYVIKTSSSICVSSSLGYTPAAKKKGAGESRNTQNGLFIWFSVDEMRASHRSPRAPLVSNFFSTKKQINQAGASNLKSRRNCGLWPSECLTFILLVSREWSE